MQKDEWLSLPPSQANEVLWGLIGGKLADVPCPQKIITPRWDMRLSKKGAYIWASECDLECLNFFYGRAKSTTNPEFAENNAKDAEALGYFVRWRAAFPSAIWVGTRGKKGNPTVTAKPPANKPTEYQWEAKGATSSAQTRAPSTSRGYDEDDSDVSF